MAPRPLRARPRPALLLVAALLVALLGLVLLGLGVRALLAARSGSASADAQTAVGALGDGGGILAWRPDLGSPREMEASTREAITDAWLRGERELRYAVRSGTVAGLEDLFQSAALEDARATAASGNALLTWAHAPQLRFYAPDGTTVAFTDTFRYVAVNPDAGTPPEVLRVATRTLDVVMMLDDGNWRTHHQRVMADRELPPALPGVPPAGVRAVRAGPEWWTRRADTLQRDVSAVRELRLDTLLLAVDLRAGPRAVTALAAPLRTVLTAARAAQVAVMLDVQAPALDPLLLPALDAALRAVPPDPGVAGVLLAPGTAPTAERLDVWRRVIRDRQPGVPIGLRGDVAPGAAEFRVGRGAWPTYRLRWWPGWPLTDARRAWQVQQFVAAHPGGLEVGTLYDEPGGTRGLLTPDGSFRPEARGVRGEARPPGLPAVLTELSPLLLLLVLEWRRTRRVNLRARQARG
ncbi:MULTISPECIES: hypothetical protein [Deinococcus]|uniref:Uncharacterized protein n=1 Tax=Deinococcus rufus TaxID=2136097 RepID=A0ABV7Z7H4_9DEIO|nr:hypothetical protein [Deinococcus sp. AB2017081]WQE95537.1 hypothetical protein U2P90_01250 [Deinococcus sp. AB2017081]